MLLVAAAKEELGDLKGEVLGVGPVVAAATAARCIAQNKPKGVIMIGTAGAYPGGPQVGEVIVSRRLGLSFGVAAMGLGYVPRPPGAVSTDAPLAALTGLEPHDVLTAGAITTDPTLASRLADGWSVEHLEAFAVAWACHDAEVPFVAILGIANKVGKGAHIEWLSNRDEAQESARQAATQLLAQLG